jgi:hypothetical protein
MQQTAIILGIYVIQDLAGSISSGWDLVDRLGCIRRFVPAVLPRNSPGGRPCLSSPWRDYDKRIGPRTLIVAASQDASLIDGIIADLPSSASNGAKFSPHQRSTRRCLQR